MINLIFFTAFTWLISQFRRTIRCHTRCLVANIAANTGNKNKVYDSSKLLH